MSPFTPFIRVLQCITRSCSLTLNVNVPRSYKCYRADISQQPGFWSQFTGGQAAYKAPCCSMTQYLTGAGITVTLPTSKSPRVVVGGSRVPTGSPTPTPSPVPSPKSKAKKNKAKKNKKMAGR